MLRNIRYGAASVHAGSAASLAALLMAVGGCAPTLPGPNSVQAPPLAARFANATSTGKQMGSAEGWWRTFGDPVLDQLVDQSLAANLDVRVALARIEQARARRHAAGAERAPEVDIGLGAGGQGVSGYQLGFPRQMQSPVFDGEINVSWEVDLFGRFASGVRSANEEIVATQADMRAVRIAVAAEVAETYFTMRGLDSRLAILRSSLAAQQQLTNHKRLMFQAGTADRGEVDREEAELASTTADIPPLERERQLAVDRLSVLLASTPQAVQAKLGAGAEQKITFPEVVPGVPADMLRSRPDVNAAEARLLAAYARIGIAEADLKPRLQLAGLVGSLVNAFSGVGFARSIEWLAAASGTAPLIDGGRRRSVVDLRRAEAEEARLHYQSVVLVAVQEVEDALASRERDAERRASLQTAAGRTRNARLQVETSWRAGVASILDLLEAQRAEFAADDQLAQVNTCVILDEVELIAALGSDDAGHSPDAHTAMK